MRAFALILIMLCCGSTALADVDYSTVDPVAEVRGIWIDAGAIPKTVPAIREMVRGYAEAHFNVLLPETICRGYAVYPSRIIERDPRFAGCIDPLPVMIDEAHKLHIEVHPWVWVFRVGYSTDKGAILRAHPEWAELDRDGRDLSPNGGYWLSPVIPEARDFLACLYAELVTKYSVDGLHLDYIRYETQEKKAFGYSPASRALFTKQYGLDPLDVEAGTLNELFWNKFRERQVDTFVQRIALQTKQIRPRAMVSAAVGIYPPDARILLMQNWPYWVANKWVDFVAPMNYSTDTTQFGKLIFRQKEAVGNQTILAEGVGMFMHKDPALTVTQIGESRRTGAFGQVIFAASYLKQTQSDALRCGPYAKPAALPFRCPWEASRALAGRSDTAVALGFLDLAAYYTTASASLADYAAYREQPTPYVSPTPPPVIISRP